MHVFVVKKFSLTFSLSKLPEIMDEFLHATIICNSSDDHISDNFETEKYKINYSFAIP